MKAVHLVNTLNALYERLNLTDSDRHIKLPLDKPHRLANLSLVCIWDNKDEKRYCINVNWYIFSSHHSTWLLLLDEWIMNWIFYTDWKFNVRNHDMFFRFWFLNIFVSNYRIGKLTVFWKVIIELFLGSEHHSYWRGKKGSSWILGSVILTLTENKNVKT
jgi:hypothetical protein